MSFFLLTLNWNYYVALIVMITWVVVLWLFSDYNTILELFCVTLGCSNNTILSDCGSRQLNVGVQASSLICNLFCGWSHFVPLWLYQIQSLPGLYLHTNQAANNQCKNILTKSSRINFSLPILLLKVTLGILELWYILAGKQI